MKDELEEQVDELTRRFNLQGQQVAYLLGWVARFEETHQGVAGLRKRLDKMERRLEKLEEKKDE